jgi:hypothetical protein
MIGERLVVVHGCANVSSGGKDARGGAWLRECKFRRQRCSGGALLRECTLRHDITS